MDAPDNSVHPKSRAAWRSWLARNHRREAGIWLIAYKKATGLPRFEYDDAVEEALCFGWVDSKPRKLDAKRSMLWFAPRKAGSGWSRPNKLRVERLLAAGLMAPSGLEKVDAARRDGSWTLLDSVEALEIPFDLATALAASPPARERFDAFPRSVKRGILEWISTAKKPETRQRRIEETARLASSNLRAQQWSGRRRQPPVAG